MGGGGPGFVVVSPDLYSHLSPFSSSTAEGKDRQGLAKAATGVLRQSLLSQYPPRRLKLFMVPKTTNSHVSDSEAAVMLQGSSKLLDKSYV